MKVTINLPEETLRMTDERAKELGVSRSAFIAISLNEKIKQDKALELMPKMFAEMMAQQKANVKNENSGNDGK